MEIIINQNDNQNISISNEDIQEININENDNQLININSNIPQDINVNENENQIILINGGGEVIGITDVLVNGVTVVSGNIAYITVPTKTSELLNNSGFITQNDIPSETDPTVPSYVKAISLADINSWNNKQDQLVSGSNIKTINNNSILGSGNIDISGDESYIAGTGINIENNIISNTITSYNDLTDLPSIPDSTSDLINDSDFVSEDDLAEVAFTGSYNSLSDTPVIPDSTSDLINDSDFVNENLLTLRLLTKQDKLISGTNIKTINNNSILGSGNLNIQASLPSNVAYTDVDNNFSAEQTISNTTGNIGSTLTVQGNTTYPEASILYLDVNNNNKAYVLGYGVGGDQFALYSRESLDTIASADKDGNIAYNGELEYKYNSTNTKAKLSLGNNLTSSDRLNLITYDTSGNQLINSTIPIMSDLPNINTFKIAKCNKTVTVNSGDSVQTLFTPPTITGYTFLGIIPEEQGFADQWLITYGFYGGNIVGAFRSFYPSTLTATLIINLLYIENNYYNNNVTNYNF